MPSLMQTDPVLVKQALDTIGTFRSNPVGYVREYLGVKSFWKGMEDMLNAMPRAIAEKKPIVIGSGHALGKDFTMAGCAPLWFLQAYGPNCKVALTAPTDRQVKKVMWAELTSRYNGRPIKDDFGRLITCELKMDADWFCLAFTTKETGGAVGKFQGFHAAAQMVVVDEAQAVDDAIFDQIDGVLTSEVRLLVVLGNPLRSTGRYAAMLRDTKRNIVLTLSCLDSPNVKAKADVVPGMCSWTWLEDKRQRWDPDGTGLDPRWQGRVLGIVPTTSINTVISHELYQKTIGRNLTPAFRTGSIGVDPGMFGDDDMVISLLESGRIIFEQAIPKCGVEAGCSHVAIALKKFFPDGQVPVVFDADGLGAAFVEMFKSMIQGANEVRVIAFHGSSTKEGVVDPVYYNLRAQAAFWAKECMEKGLVCFDEDEYAMQEALEETWMMKHKGKIQLEPKEDIKERLGRSPNRWDARKLAIWGMKFAQKIRKPDQWKTRNEDGYSMPAHSMGSGGYMTA